MSPKRHRSTATHASRRGGDGNTPGKKQTGSQRVAMVGEAPPVLEALRKGYAWPAALRLLGTYVVLTVALYGAGEPYSRGWSPIIEAQLALVQGHFAAPMVAVASVDGQTVLRFEGTVTEALRARFPGIPVGEKVWASTLQAHLHNHLILVFSLLAAWPARSARRRVQLLLAGLPAAAIATSLDLPFALAGLALGEVYAAFDPGLLRTDPLVRYFDFLQAGGRLLLPIVAAGLVVLGQGGGRRPRSA